MTERAPHGDAPHVVWERFETGARIGHHLRCYAEVGSTMDVAWAWAEAGAPHGAAVMALAQREGRGRFGRAWLSEPGDSLLMSVVTHPPVDLAPLLSVIASLAVRRAVATLAGFTCELKWPNDLLHDGRKLCGVLVETRTAPADRSRGSMGATTSVIGVGLNLNLDPATYPQIRDTATSVRLVTGKRTDPADSAVAVLRALDSAYARATAAGDPSWGSTGVLAEWRAALGTLGKRVIAREGERVIHGVATDVDAAGALLVRDDGGVVHRLSAGEVTLQA